MPAPARVRYAPSPTGHTHIGGARTALYNYLLARQTGGQFILRIEDTDAKRSARIYEDEILAALRWLGLTWDEGPDVGGPAGPYRQSERKAIYLEHAQRLIDSGHAYRCFCTRERLDQVRKELEQRKELARYDRHCRAVPPDEARRRADAGESHVIRFRAPDSGTTTVVDQLRGPITIENRTLDDMILVKSDGLALYHLASVVDDHAMRITHVLRGLEWLGTFPLHGLITRALGFEEPIWCHLSVFLKPAGKGKMSKRDLSSEQSIYVIGAPGLEPSQDTTGLRELGLRAGGGAELGGAHGRLVRGRRGCAVTRCDVRALPARPLEHRPGAGQLREARSLQRALPPPAAGRRARRPDRALLRRRRPLDQPAGARADCAARAGADRDLARRGGNGGLLLPRRGRASTRGFSGERAHRRRVAGGARTRPRDARGPPRVRSRDHRAAAAGARRGARIRSRASSSASCAWRSPGRP